MWRRESSDEPRLGAGDAARLVNAGASVESVEALVRGREVRRFRVLIGGGR